MSALVIRKSLTSLASASLTLMVLGASVAQAQAA
jgi:hypothetical protein